MDNIHVYAHTTGMAWLIRIRFLILILNGIRILILILVDRCCPPTTANMHSVGKTSDKHTRTTYKGTALICDADQPLLVAA